MLELHIIIYKPRAIQVLIPAYEPHSQALSIRMSRNNPAALRVRFNDSLTAVLMPLDM